MTNRELDFLIADKIFFKYVDKAVGMQGNCDDVDCCSGEEIPYYSSDMNLSRLVEQEIERCGLQSQYGDILAIIEQDMCKDCATHPPMNWLCAHASPKSRCLAALKTVGVEL